MMREPDKKPSAYESLGGNIKDPSPDQVIASCANYLERLSKWAEANGMKRINSSGHTVAESLFLWSEALKDLL